MKYKQYPTFKRGEVLKKFNKLSKKERELIEKFLKYVSITSKSSKRIDNNRRNLMHFRVITGKEFNKITLQDLRDYLSLLNNSKLTRATHNELKACIKRFLKWNFKDWSKRFDELRDIKLRFGINEEKINSGTLLKKEEIEKIMDTETRLIWKTFFITLYESGLRPIELRTIKWDGIDLNEDGEMSKINIFATKTSKARSVYVKEATNYLKRLKEKRDKETPLVFPSPRDNTIPFTKDLVSHWLNRLSQKAIGRKVTPYILRHTRAKELYLNNEVPDSVVKKFLGHSKDMRDVYTRLSSEDVKEAMVKSVYQFEDLPPEKKHELEKRIEKLEEQMKFQNNMIIDLHEQLLEEEEINISRGRRKGGKE